MPDKEMITKSVSIEQGQYDYCHKIGSNFSDGVRNAVDFHNEFHPLIESLVIAKGALDSGVLNLGEYAGVVARGTQEFFDKINKTQTKGKGE